MKINISIAASPFVLDKADLRWLRRDPKGFAASLHTSDLTALIRTCNDQYHNEGQSQLTDPQYEIILDELRTRKPTHSLLSNVGAAIPKGRTKVELPYPLFSLGKIKPGTPSFTQWVAVHKGPWVVSDKEDGVSIEAIYDKGRPTAAYTRGKGIYGQNVSHLIPYFGIPLTIPYKKRFAVRFEVAMTEQAFNTHFSKEKSVTTGKKYENARNLVAGIVNKLHTQHAAVGHIKHYAYEIIEPRMKPSEALPLMKSYGFNIVAYKVVKELDEVALTKYLALRKTKSPIEIDGLVIEQDKKTVRPTKGNPEYAISFKVTTDENTVDTEVLEVKWTDSKYGTAKPVVWIKPVRLEGVTVTKASGFNAQFIMTGFRQKDNKTKTGKKNMPIGPGAIVRLTRSGGVIPHIIQVVKAARKPDMPTRPYEFDEKGVNIKFVDNSNLARDKRITDFFVVLGIDFIKLKTVQNLAAAGLNSILKIIRAKPADFLAIDGIQAKSAQKLYDSIQDKITKPIDLPILMKASGNFGQGMGSRRLVEILKAYPNVLTDYELKGEDFVLDTVIKIPGFQTKTAQVFVDGIPGYLKWFKRSRLVTKTLTVQKVKVTGSTLKGQAVGFTGFRDKDLALLIQQNGGTVTEGIKKETTLLLIPDSSYENNKTSKAAASGITVLPVAAFMQKYRL